MSEMQKRMTIRKLRIKDIAESRFMPSPGVMQPAFIITPSGMKASRIRVMGVNVGKFVSEDKNYAAMTVDDGSATIRMKSFGSTKMLENVGEGQTVDVIGKVKEYNGETYITPEIVRTVNDANAEVLHRLEILKAHSDWKSKTKAVEKAMAETPDAEAVKNALKHKVDAKDVEAIMEALDSQKETKAEKKEAEGGARAKVLEIVSSTDTGSGVSYRDIFAEAKLDERTVEKAITELLEDGICYEPKPGQLKKC